MFIVLWLLPQFLDLWYKMKFLYAMFSEIYGHDGAGKKTKKVKGLLVDLLKEISRFYGVFWHTR